MIGKKKRREHEVRNQFEEKFQRSRLAKEKRLKEKIHERAKLNDKSAVYKAKKEENVIIDDCLLFHYRCFYSF